MTAPPSPERTHGFRVLLLAVSLFVLAGSVLAGSPGARAETPPPGLGGFSPGFLITDTRMFDSTAMDRAGVDSFLDAQGANCVDGTDGADCLKNLTADTPQRAATAYCAAIPAANNATAGRIITDVAQACDVNPQVILVMLQKEQGLITTRNATPTQLEKALGFRCPDFQACDPAFGGFVHQIYHGISRLQEYGDPARGYRYQAGRTYDIQYSPFEFCGYGEVKIFNRATAALYNYTPFTPTEATLAAGAGAVPDDVCATYGNRNFFRTFSLWFGSPTGAPEDRYPITAPWGKDPAAPFTDVPYGSSIFFTEIAWMKHTELSTGWADGTYRPLQPIARDAMVAFLYRAAGEPAFTPPRTSPFKDVPRSSQFFNEIAWAESEGITTGWSDGTFRPLQPVNRDAMAAFLYRSAGEPAFTPPRTSPFTDVPRSSLFYKEIAWAEDERITTGWSDGTYRPLQSINRDAMAAFIYRMTID
ncbi:S-layer homology domain-containing protein [Brachybacterium sp. AOP42-C2-15]|uniref:S-layer homology domain-containing protein n=1 Tax=unclassified Brachybacterium TaxID=2623841 RepID=UPI003F939870